MTAIALIPVDLERTALNGPGCAGEAVAGRPLLWHTVQLARRIEGITRVVVIHPGAQQVAPLIDGADTFAVDSLDDRWVKRWHIARRWSPRGWRGGLGGATVFDECLPAGPLLQAMDHFKAEHAVLLRGEWCLLDPALCGQVLAKHLEAPDAFKACFTQAPPGICGIATSRDVLSQLHEHHAAFAHILGYQPTAPQADPVGKDVNLPIDSDLRDTHLRLIGDTTDSLALIRRIADELGDDFADADADTIAATARRISQFPELPDWIHVELTPRRQVTGPITPQHYVTFERPDMDVDLAGRIFQQLPAGEACVMFGGLGDALLHPQWDTIVQQAHEAGVASIGIETDLLCDESDLTNILELPIDVVVVRLNADRAETYRRVMGEDLFRKVIENLQSLFNQRNRRGNDLLRGLGSSRTLRVRSGNSGHTVPGSVAGVGVPWIVPSMVKTAETLGDLEGFFDKWVHLSGHALLDGPRCGCGLMPEQGVVCMTPPDRGPCRQLGRRMSILSDGSVAQCDQDWQGRGALGDLKITALADIWQQAHQLAAAHEQGRYTQLTLCGSCGDWHRA
ncbi:MAG: SPASM domain-containing protein [Phycisphaeraceae bacterium]|nr:SPASM domain-containing protein [Phycisphaeraceae bacterium]